jgi:hypothetical protein
MAGLRSSVAIAVLLASWLAGTAQAQEPVDDPVLVAGEASQVRDQYCTDASDAAITLQAEGTAAVSAVWARVSRSYDQHKAVYLLYWRGLLGQCIDKTALVRQDLESFVVVVGDDPAYREQVRDAERRLKRLAIVEAQAAGKVDPRPGIGVGIGVAAGGAVLGGLAAWQGQRMQELNTQFHAGGLQQGSYDTLSVDGQAAALASNALSGAAVAAGATGLTVLAISAAITHSQSSTVAVVLPTPDGITLGIGGRW